MRRSFPQFMFAIVVLGVLMSRLAQDPPLAGMEETFITWLVANSNGDHSSAPVTLIEINDNCLLYYALPWSPLNYALFLDAALQFKARVAAIEPVLMWDDSKLTAEQELQQPQFERYLHECILRTPLLEMGAELGYPEDPDVLPALQPMPVLRDVTGPMEAVPDYTIVEAEPGDDIRLTAGLGFANIPASEATARHAPMVFRYRGQVVPSFALEAMMLYYGVRPEDVRVGLGTEIKLGNKLSIPVNEAGALLLDWKQPYDRAGFDDLELAANQLDNKHAPIIDPAALKDRLLILARTDAASQTLPLPNGRMGSAGEVYAEAVATAEAGSYARTAGRFGKWLVLALAVGLGWTVSNRPKLVAAPLVAAFLAAYLLVCLVVFESARVALPLTPMLGLAAFIGVFRMIEAEKEGTLEFRRVRWAWKKWVGPGIKWAWGRARERITDVMKRETGK